MASIFTLPNELLLSSLLSRFPCRGQQIRTLATLLSTRAAPSRNIVLHGLEATGKSAVTKAVLEALSSTTSEPGTLNGDSGHESYREDICYSIIRSAECITGRHLLEQTVGAIAKAVESRDSVGRCESIAQLVVQIGGLVEGWTAVDKAEAAKQRFVLVFDGIDRQREASPTLLPALARLGEIIPRLTTIFIVTSPRPHFLHLPGVPHIHFPTYRKPEILQILILSEPSLQLPAGQEETKEIWSRYCSAVWDSLAKHSGRDIISIRSVCLRLWPAFVAPILDGTYTSKEFSRLLVFKRSLFQDDKVLVPSIVSNNKPATAGEPNTKQQGIGTQLPYFSRLLLVASYLASFNKPTTDQIHFMKTAAAKRRKKGGGTALSRGQNGVAKSRKISRKLLGPQAFVLERMLAIFHAIKLDGDDRGRYGSARRGNGGQTCEADIQTAIATLASLRLLVKIGAANSADTLDSGSKWRVAVGWDFVRGIARSVGVEVEDYLAD